MAVKDWKDLPVELYPQAGETLAEHYARIDAYAGANPGVLTPLSAAALKDLEARAQAEIDTAVTKVSVSNERVWLTDPLLPGGPADPTGVADSSAAIKAAIAKASSTTGGPGGAGRALIGGPPGIYKSLENIYVPGSIGFGTPARQGALSFSLPNQTGRPTQAHVGNVAAGATVIPYSNKGLGATAPSFLAATPSTPQTVMVGSHVITYTGDTGTSLTGCVLASGAPLPVLGANNAIVQGWGMHFGNPIAKATHTVLDESCSVMGPGGDTSGWLSHTPPSAMDGVWMGDKCRINCQVKGFRMGVGFSTDHQHIGPSFKASACYASVYFALPDALGGGADQVFEPGARLEGNIWTGIYLEASCGMINNSFHHAHFGFGPFGIVKAALTGGARDYPYIAVVGVWDDMAWEHVGIGAIVSVDGKSALRNIRHRGGAIIVSDLHRPAGWATGPVVVANEISGEWDGQNLFILPAGAPASVDADVLLGSFGDLGATIAACKAQAKPFARGVNIPTGLTANVRFESSNHSGRMFPALSTSAIVSGDVCGWRNDRVALLDVTVAAVAGVAMLPIQNQIVALATSGEGLVPVNVPTTTHPPTSFAAAPSATAGTRGTGTFYGKVSALLSGGGETAASVEANVAYASGQSATWTWVAPSGLPNGQTVTGYRLYIGSASGGQTGYISVGNVLSYTDAGAALTTKSPGAVNVGCYIYGIGWVRANPATPGKAMRASGAFDTAGPVFAWTFAQADNGATASVRITPSLA